MKKLNLLLIAITLSLFSYSQVFFRTTKNTFSTYNEKKGFFEECETKNEIVSFMVKDSIILTSDTLYSPYIIEHKEKETNESGSVNITFYCRDKYDNYCLAFFNRLSSGYSWLTFMYKNYSINYTIE